MTKNTTLPIAYPFKKILRRVFTLGLILVSALSVSAQQEDSSPIKLKITGDIDPNTQSSTLWIIRQNETPKYPLAEVPIVEGKIDYEFETSEPDRFYIISGDDLMNKGMCMPIHFFAENGQIKFTGRDDADNMDCLQLHLVESDAQLNNRLLDYNQFLKDNFVQKQDSLSAIAQSLTEEEFYSEAGRAFWSEFNELFAKINQYPDSLQLLEQRNEMYHKRDRMQNEGTMYSPLYSDLLQQMKDLSNQIMEYDLENLATEDGDLFCLSVLCEDFTRAEGNDQMRNRIIEAYLTNLENRFSNTIMGERMTQKVVGYEVSHVGGRYPDFQLPDADSRMHNIKDLIGDRIVLIDLWGSTCTPCRINSRSMIPVYKEFKDKGFDIIGIAREYKNLDGFHHAVEKDGYPWMQLIELDDSTGIFNLHGIPNSMGGTYLVGPVKSESSETDGESKPEIRILLINPTADELREYLTNHLEQ